ncbi:hypothetical protein FHX63_005316 [Cupriavidus plantarum]|uniref:Uncharacterized protein n=2 Tax=Cupriavidus plantarum TaxID=942865 RepID=A0A316EMM5_9BURK|nr:hypothetical protein [Cupriavidus plantarum]PWK33369.1 hypothetical protein C7419_10442 [Cupriavidus plantarum]REE87694.1 hypothetical protein C7418_5193 [Cupriavidus plantarum]RLK30128.1 hypothetical protein C7417_5231 [Cupriavidus plantarum]CAG2145364.1 hypothetical protein LMG26296_03712 [Cupriavidus plantarum]
MMYVILASKPGQFRTEPMEGTLDALRPLETYDYVFYGRATASFVIAELHQPVKVRVIDETGGSDAETINLVPSKFLERFDTLDAARAALRDLAKFGTMDLSLKKR